MQHTAGELFCGAGGLALGLVRAGFKYLWGIDCDRWACRTFVENIRCLCLNQKVEEVSFSALPAPEGLVFGFPCNDFSIVGKRKGTGGYYGRLYKEAVRALSELRPVWFLAENVLGLLSSGEGTGILEEFSRAGRGYVVAVHLFKFEQYGVPQKRWRVVACGIDYRLGIRFYPPAPTHKVPVTCGEALKGVESVPHNNELPRHTPKVVELLRHIPEGSNAWDPRVPDSLKPKVENCRLSLIYRRLKIDEPAYTVTASGGGGTHMYHFEEPRALTNRERARLQTFPDDFIFYGPKEAVRKQIGMAVPPLAAEVIGRALLACLEGKPYEHVEPSEGFIVPPKAGARPATVQTVGVVKHG